MSAGEGGRPSVPHHMRVPTDRQRTVRAPEFGSPPLPLSEEAETVRESVDPALAEMLAVLRDPSGVTTESLLKLLLLSQRHATAATRQQDKLGVDLGVGMLKQQIGSMVASRTLSEKARKTLLTAVYSGGWAAAFVFGIWMLLAGRAREEAAAVIVAPAVAAEAKVLTIEERVAATEKRHDATEESLAKLSASVESLNGAVVMLVERLPDPPPTVIDVPKPRPKKGLDE